MSSPQSPDPVAPSDVKPTGEGATLQPDIKGATIGVNLLYLPPGTVSGTATYAWSVLREMATLRAVKLVLFCQDGFSRLPHEAGWCEIVTVPRFDNVYKRVLWEQAFLPGLAERHGVDLLFSPGYVSPLRGRFAKVATVHDMFYRLIPTLIRKSQQLYWRTMIPLTVRLCDAVIAVSHNTASDIVDAFPSAAGKVQVVHEASVMDPARLTVAETVSPSEKSFVLMVANITAIKNVDTVARAAALLRDGGRDVPIRVIGQDHFGLLRDAIQRHGVEDVVLPLGYVDDAALGAHYRHAICVIHPSIYEGFGLPVLEAQALGCPVISSRGGSLPEVAGDGALYFDHASPTELVEAILRLIDHPAERQELIRKGLENERRFSWRRAAVETLAVFADVLSRTRRGKR